MNETNVSVGGLEEGDNGGSPGVQDESGKLQEQDKLLVLQGERREMQTKLKELLAEREQLLAKAPDAERSVLDAISSEEQHSVKENVSQLLRSEELLAEQKQLTCKLSHLESLPRDSWKIVPQDEENSKKEEGGNVSVGGSKNSKKLCLGFRV
jgi:seryl-tRNA synthetase